MFKFAYLSIENPNNKKVWSGTHYSLFKHLKTIGYVDVLGPYEPKPVILILRIINQITKYLFRKRIAYRLTRVIAKKNAKYFKEKLNGKSFDFIIAPAACAEIAYLETNIPIIYILDGTVNVCLNYHKNLSNLLSASINQSEELEQLAINKSKFVIASSKWCANSVIEHYGKNKNDVFTIPYGANLETIPTNTESKKLSFNEQFKLLFVGVYWQNKGGDIAINALNILNKMGYDVTLTVVGCVPTGKINENVKIIEFLDKNSDEGQKKMAAIFKEHHALILPTRFDCTPIVINEASAFGLPSLVSNTGGVEGHLKENINGHLIEYTDDGTAFAKVVANWLTNPKSYENISQSTLKLYQTTNNWQNWKDELKKILLTLNV